MPRKAKAGRNVLFSEPIAKLSKIPSSLAGEGLLQGAPLESLLSLPNDA